MTVFNGLKGQGETVCAWGGRGLQLQKHLCLPALLTVCLGLKQGYGDLGPNHRVKYINLL